MRLPSFWCCDSVCLIKWRQWLFPITCVTTPSDVILAQQRPTHTYTEILEPSVFPDADIYVSVVSFTHQVASKDWFIAIVSTTVETANPELEVKPGLDLLGAIKQRVVHVSDVYRPTDAGSQSQVFISESFDATSHFETTCDDVLNIFRRGTGEDFDFSKVKHDLGEEN